MSGWLNNIKAIQALLESTGLKYLFTRRISQDLLENWFGAIQSKDGCRDTHTCQQFKHAYRAVCIKKLQCTLKGANCQSDEGRLIATIKELVKARPKPNNNPLASLELLATVSCQSSKLKLPVVIPDHTYTATNGPNFTKIEMQSMFYLAGLVAKKGLQKVKCSDVARQSPPPMLNV